MGEQGLSLNVYTKTKSGMVANQLGESKAIQDICNGLMSNKWFDSFIVQERLKNHTYFLKVHLSEYIHSIRVITFINSAEQCQILHTHLDLATGSDNIASQKASLG